MEPDIEKYYDNYTKTFRLPDDKLNINPKGLGWVIFDKMKERLKHIAQIDAETGTEDLYESFLDRIIRTALKMKSLGIGIGDVITIHSHNHLNNTVPLFAALFLRAQISPLDPSMSREDTKYLLNLIKPKMMFASTGSEKFIEEISETIGLDVKIVSFGGTVGFIDFKEFVSFECDVDHFQPCASDNLDETVLIIFTSGTTGFPKGVCMSNKVLLVKQNYGFTSIFKVSLADSPLHFVSQIFLVLVNALRGQTTVVCKKVNPRLTWEYIIKYKVNVFFLLPCDAMGISQNIPKFEKHSLELIYISGSTIPWDCMEKLRAALPKAKIYAGYALTETFNLLSTANTKAYYKKNCIGIPIPGGSYRIVDPDTEEVLGFNQIGELRVKTKWCMSGYYKEDSSNAWDSNGYFKTGDLMYYDDEYSFFMVDRIKETFKFRYWNFIPAKLEKILYDHPEVLKAVVVGLPNREDHNHAIAVVVPVPGARVTPEELRKFVDDQVDDRNRLRAGVKFVRELPMSPRGKIRKRDIVKMLLNNEF